MNWINTNLWFISHILVILYLFIYILGGYTACCVLQEKSGGCMFSVGIFSFITLLYLIYMYNKRDKLVVNNIIGTIANFSSYILFWLIYFYISVGIINIILMVFGVGHIKLSVDKPFNIIV